MEVRKGFALQSCEHGSYVRCLATPENQHPLSPLGSQPPTLASIISQYSTNVDAHASRKFQAYITVCTMVWEAEIPNVRIHVLIVEPPSQTGFTWSLD